MSCSLRNSDFQTLCYLLVASLTVLDHPVGIRLEALENVLHLGAPDVTLHSFCEELFARTLFKKTDFVTYRTHALFSSQFSCLASIILFLSSC